MTSLLNMSGNKKLLGLLAMLAVFQGCDLLGPRIGSEIQFSPYLESVGKTKVSYSGIKDGTLERIDWNPGDRILISQTYNGETAEAVYEITEVTASGYRSKAQIAAVSAENALMYKGDGDYIYRCYYPADGDHLNGETFTFTVPSSQSGDVSSGLFMIATQQVSSAKKISLEFSPVVNTYQFELPAGTTEIQIESPAETLSGTFTITNGNIAFSENGAKTITMSNPVSPVRFFTVPKAFGNGALFVRLNRIKMYELNSPYSNAFVKLNFSGMTTRMSSLVTGAVHAEANKRGYGWYLDGDGDFAINGQKIDPDKIWELIESVVDLNVSGTWEMTEIYPEDLNVFPNLRTVNINATNLTHAEISNPNITEITIFTQPQCTIDIHDCSSLTKLELKSNNGINDVSIRNNDLLEWFTIDYPHTELTVRCVDCEKLRGFSVTQSYGIRYHVEVSGCPKWEGYTMPNNSTQF